MRLLSLLMLFAVATILNASDSDHEHDHSHDHDHAHHEEEFKEHAAHEHGRATANISYIEDSVKIEFQFPSIDIFGFEHAPRSEQDRETIFVKLSFLEETSNVIATDPACTEISSDVDSNILETNDHDEEHHHHHEEHKEHHEEHNEQVHSDVTAVYELHCNHETKLTFQLFSEFPSLEGIAVQYVSEQEQRLINVNPNKPVITLTK